GGHHVEQASLGSAQSAHRVEINNSHAACWSPCLVAKSSKTTRARICRADNRRSSWRNRCQSADGSAAFNPSAIHTSRFRTAWLACSFIGPRSQAAQGNVKPCLG